MAEPGDFVRCSARLRTVMSPHFVALLKRGLSVVVAFHAIKVPPRAWMKESVPLTNADHRLHWVDAPDNASMARLASRNVSGEHPFAVTEAQFPRVSAHCAAPSPEEGLRIVRHPASAVD